MEEKIEIKDFFKSLGRKLNGEDVIPYAYQLTYSLLLSIFPFIIFLLTFVGLLKLDSNSILNQIKNVMPGDAFSMFSGIIKEVMEKQSGGLLSVSIITAIWSASAGFKSFMKAMNKVFKIREERTFLSVNFFAVLYVILLALGLIGSIFLLIFGEQVFATIQNFVKVDLGFLQSAFTKIIPVIFIFVLFVLFYMFVPSKNVKFKYAFPGAIFSTLAFIFVSLGFKFYVNNFANYSKFYGAMGTVVMLMFWLLLISMIMIIGGAVNAVLIEKKGISNPFMRNGRIKENLITKKAIQTVKNRNHYDPHERK